MDTKDTTYSKHNKIGDSDFNWQKIVVIVLEINKM